ncbi:hypothetical protein [Methylocella sp.]|uniref:hypothetical protein n=1 Tax=Methylocella sp. TaxID=1978226 RepID=UPI0035AE301D
MSKPNEFYIGVIELFAVLVPGSIAVAILAPLLAELSLPSAVEYPRNDFAQWAAFVIGAYAAGHIVFFFASFMDDFADALRDRIQRSVTADEARERQLTALKRLIVDRHVGNWRAHDCASQICSSFLRDARANGVKLYQWARATLMLKLPAAADDVQRIEADAKLFRSLVVVFLLASIVFCKEHRLAAALGAFILVVPCAFRYYERRMKGATQAFIYIITLDSLGELKAKEND